MSSPLYRLSLFYTLHQVDPMAVPAAASPFRLVNQLTGAAQEINEPVYRLLLQLQQPCTIKAVANQLQQDFNVSAEEALEATTSFLLELTTDGTVVTQEEWLPPAIGPYGITGHLTTTLNNCLWVARAAAKSQPLVIKQLIPHSYATTAAFEQDKSRLQRTYAFLLQVQHIPQVVKAVDWLANEAALVMEYIDGQNLAGWVYTKPAFSEKLAIATQLFAAVSAIHDAGCSHGDLFTTNVLITPERQLRLIDPGDKRCTNAAIHPVDMAAVREASCPHYAPEILQRWSRVPGTGDWQRTDTYQTGFLLYFLLYEHWPFYGSGHELANAICHTQPVVPAHLPDGNTTPACIHDLLHRLLHKDPAQRPAKLLPAWQNTLAMIQPGIGQHCPPGRRKTVTTAAPEQNCL